MADARILVRPLLYNASPIGIMAPSNTITGHSMCLYSMFGFNNLEATKAKTHSKNAITTFKKFVITRSKQNENKPSDKRILESSFITSCSSLVAINNTSPDLKCSFDKLP